MRHLVEGKGLADRIGIDSAGTSGWHVGEAPDGRAQQEARSRGIDLSHQRGRGVADCDFADFDYILAMDTANFETLLSRCPAQYRDRIYRCMDFAPELGIQDVPDPYYGGDQGFVKVFDMLESACIAPSCDFC